MTTEQNVIISHHPDGYIAVSLYVRDGNVWMNQNQLSSPIMVSVITVF